MYLMYFIFTKAQNEKRLKIHANHNVKMENEIIQYLTSLSAEQLKTFFEYHLAELKLLSYHYHTFESVLEENIELSETFNRIDKVFYKKNSIFEKIFENSELKNNIIFLIESEFNIERRLYYNISPQRLALEFFINILKDYFYEIFGKNMHYMHLYVILMRKNYRDYKY